MSRIDLPVLLITLYTQTISYLKMTVLKDSPPVLSEFVIFKDSPKGQSLDSIYLKMTVLRFLDSTIFLIYKKIANYYCYYQIELTIFSISSYFTLSYLSKAFLEFSALLKHFQYPTHLHDFLSLFLKSITSFKG